MDRELIDKAWACLPKEFKEEVKDIFRKCFGVPKYEAITIKPMLLDSLFGHHNLTSDEEGEEMVCCPKYKIGSALDYCDELDSISGSHNMLNWGKQMIAYLFGSKCLLDEDAHEDNFATKKPQPAEPKFKIGDKVRVKFNAKELHSNPDPSKNIYYWQTARDKYLGKVFKITDIWKSGTITLNTAEVMFWEPFDLEPYTKPKDDKHFDNILKDSFAKERRLNIATQIVASMIGSDDWTTWRGSSNKEIWHNMAKSSLEIADALIDECEKKGGQDAQTDKQMRHLRQTDSHENQGCQN